MITNLEQSKKWYVRAVSDSLILNYHASESTAESAIEAYRLKARLNKYPEAQLHYDVDDTADEIVGMGFLK